MKIRSILSLRSLALTGVALLLLAAAPSRVYAAFIFTLSQVGNNVVINGSGSINTTALVGDGLSNGSNFAPKYGYILSTSSATAYSGITGPASFGSGGLTTITSMTGSSVGIYGANGFVFTPTSYTSGAQLTDSYTIANATFASLGFTPGTYTYTWGTGADADSFTVTGGVPEPSTWLGGAFCIGVLTVVLLRHLNHKPA